MTYYKLKHRMNDSVCYAIQITGDNDNELRQFMEHFFGKEFLASIDVSYKLYPKQLVGEWILATPSEKNTYKYWWCSDDYKIRKFEQIDEIEHIKIDGTKLVNDIYLNMTENFQKMKCQLKENTKQDLANALFELRENEQEKDNESVPKKESKSKRKKDSLFFYKLKRRDSSAVWYGMQITGENQQDLEEFLDAFSVNCGSDKLKKEVIDNGCYNSGIDCFRWLVLRENHNGTYDWFKHSDSAFKETFEIIEEIEFCGDSKKTRFKRDLSALINQYNYDTKADTFDFVLADYLYNCLKNYIKANKRNNELLLNEEL